MKKLILFLWLFTTTVFSQNSLTIKNVKAGPGNKAKIVVALDNKDAVAGLQFKIKVPNDLIVAERKAAFTSRKTNHVIYPKRKGNGEYLFICISPTNDSFKENTGDLIEIPIEIPVNYAIGKEFDITFTQAIVSSPEAKDIGKNHKNGKLTIIKGETPDLKVSNVTFTSKKITPHKETTVKWNVENIGELSAEGGWIERVYLVSQKSNKEYLIGTSYYNDKLLKKGTVNREQTFKIPAIIGFDGAVKIKVEVTPNRAVKEPAINSANNTVLSTEVANLLKKITLTIDREKVLKNSDDKIRVNLVRSGAISAAEKFTISSDGNKFFKLPIAITLDKNQSSNFVYLTLNQVDEYVGDKKITLTASGNDYAKDTDSFTLIEDKKIMLSLSYPSNYSSAIGSKIKFTLKADYANSVDKVITLSASNVKRIQLPKTVTLKAGQKEVSFEGEVLDTKGIEKAVKIVVNTSVKGYVSASEEIALKSINIPKFQLKLSPSTVSESNGIKGTEATLTRTTHFDKPVMVRLVVSEKEQLIVPKEILFNKGERTKIFNLGVIDNGVVEGSRNVTVSSYIKFESCNCIDKKDATTTVSKEVTILDNDGLAIMLKATPSTVKGGGKNNILKVSRNVTNPALLQKPVVVTLSSESSSVLTLPSKVTIPANKKEVTVKFDTKIDYASNEDKSIRINAEAVDYAKGFTWVLIADQNKPDVIIEKIALRKNIEAGGKVEILTTIKNQGFASFKKGGELSYYLSKNNSIQGLEPFANSILTKEIKPTESFTIKESIEIPSVAGDFNLIAVVNGDKAITELDVENNRNFQEVSVLPTYLVTLRSDKKVYKPTEAVFVSGEAKSKGGLVSNAEIEIIVNNGNFSRTFTAKTNAAGKFVYKFVPLENESGIYTVSAAYPGFKVKPQVTFTILGFEIVNKPNYIKWQPLVNFPLEKELILKNNTNINLTNVKINVIGAKDFEIQQTPISIPANTKKALRFKILSKKSTPVNQFQEYTIEIVSNEGASLKETIYYHSKTKQAKLVSNPITIEATMAKNKSRLYEFTVKNIGDVDAKNLEIRIPSLSWLTLQSSNKIDKLLAGEEMKVVLKLKPTAKEQVNVPINGTIVAKATNSKSLVIPFRIETVSRDTGEIVVDATDEYTYNTASAKHIKGAKVTIKHPFTGAVIAEGITGEDGKYTVPSVNEGWYTVVVTAEKHKTFQNNILVNPSRKTQVNAFLSIQAVTYTWGVVKDKITDEYKVKLITKFETNVPKPVVVMELDNPNLDLKEGESRMVNLTVTNHGLIAANKVKIGVSDIEGYQITPLIKTMEVLKAKSTVVVPILLKRISKTTSRSSKVCFSGNVTLDARYFCNTEKSMFSFTTFVSINCSPRIVPDIIGSPGPGSPSPGSPIGGCCSGGHGPSGTPGSIAYLDICDPCTAQVIGTLLVCTPIPHGDKISCVLGLATSTSHEDLAYAVFGCRLGRLPGCIFSILKIKRDCFPGPSGGFFRKGTNAKKGNWDYIIDDFNKIRIAYKTVEKRLNEYYKNTELLANYKELSLLMQIVTKNIDEERPFLTQDIANLKKKFAGNTIVTSSYLDKFTGRWNRTLEAWSKGVYSPNTTYEDIVDKTKLDEYNKIAKDLEAYVIKRGFTSVGEMYQKDLAEIKAYTEEKQKEKSSTCASVSIEFEQKLTMTREAFKGTLKINNNSSKKIKDVNLELIVRNEKGENKTNLFQINKEAFLSGTGLVESNSNKQGLVTFIPSKKAAPTTKLAYSFGGVLSYYDEEQKERVSVNLNPVTLEVSPSPDLVLDYFMQRDIIADDALTEEKVEPSIPAELSLMITNDGYGKAENVKVESVQPKIIENKKGLLIDFKLIGSNLNNKEKELGLLNINFKDIEAKKTKVGQWWFTSSLMGHFIKYNVNVTHLNSFGNKNLSLIKSAQVHELIKSVRNYGDKADDIDDFLVNDVADAHDTPDAIYYSKTGKYDEVYKADKITSLNVISASNLTTKITLNPKTTGWNYSFVNDPGNDKYKLVKVIRDKDKKEMPLKNFWQTFVTLRDGLNPKYENKLHVLDKISEIHTYTLHYKPIDENTPKIVSIEGITTKNTDKPVELLKVTFNKEIDVNTFKSGNINLLRQGEVVDNNAILVGKIDAKTYSINLKKVTNQSGYYELTASSVGVKDLLGNEGANAKKVTWLQFLNELGILKFESDQIRKQSINSVTVTFNKKIRIEEFTADKITVNNKPVNNVIIKQIDEFNYNISGLNALNTKDGSYSMDIDLPKITAASGEKGLAKQTFTWMVDNNLPKIVKAEKLGQGALHSQHITEIDVKLNRKLANTFTTDFVELFKNNQKVAAPIVVSKIDSITYNISGFGDYTKANANYQVRINQANFKDENDNTGEKVYVVDWLVDLQKIQAVSDLKLTPDRGISSTDNITSGNDIKLQYKTLQDDLTVEVYEMLATKSILLGKQKRDKKGIYTIPLKDKKGAKRFKVVAIDSKGNRSEPKIITTYIDFSDITTVIEPLKTTAEKCYDFDAVKLNFSENIVDLTKEAISLQTSGVAIPIKDIKISKISDKSYQISNISYDKNGLITLEVDKTKITKKLTGLRGANIVSKQIGAPNNYKVTIVGEDKPAVKKVYEYKATGNIDKFDWIVINGEIITKTKNTISVKWNEKGKQTLLLRYKTPLGCKSSKTKEVEVVEETLHIEEVKQSKSTKIAPVPNDGQFTIHTNQVIKNCTIQVFDISGKEVYKEDNVTINQKVKKIVLGQVPSGVYILLLQNGEEKLNFKFIVK